tara:strand:- start:849 stop:1205 length:357 start_codon:yes stop_codon:yes gene_type:complete
MRTPIGISTEHTIILSDYLTLVLDCIEDVSAINKFNNYKDILDIIIEYNNNYKIGLGTGNFKDFLSIIPVQVSVMTNGYLAGLENQNNRKKVRAYKFLLAEQTHELLINVNNLKTEYE